VKLWRWLARLSGDAQALGERVDGLDELSQSLNGRVGRLDALSQTLDEQLNELRQVSEDLQALSERVGTLEHLPADVQKLQQQVTGLEQLPTYLPELQEQLSGLQQLPEEVRTLNERGSRWDQLPHDIQAFAHRVNRVEERLAEIERLAEQAAAPAAATESMLVGGRPDGHPSGECSANGAEPCLESPGSCQLPSFRESVPASETEASGTGPQPREPVGVDVGGPTPLSLAPDRQEPPAPAGSDLGWILVFAEAIRQGRIQVENIGQADLDRWVEVASKVERAGERSELGDGFTRLMEQSRSLLGIDIVRPQIGSSALQASVEVVDDGPLDGTVSEVVAVGLRTCDALLRPARVKSEPR
jgi:hypothetical protein